MTIVLPWPPKELNPNNPPSANPPDCDNIIAAFKYGQDTLARTVGIDDSKLRITYALEIGEPLPPFGTVELEVLC